MPEQRDLTTQQKIGWTVLGALLGGALAYAVLRDSDDPDRPPIIVRNGSVIVEEYASSVRGSLEHESGKTWVHKHAHTGPKRLNAFVVGVASNSCGSGSVNFVSNVKKATFTYVKGDDTWQIVLENRGNRVVIDVVSGPDPTNDNAYTLKFSDDPARLTQVALQRPGGTETCLLDAGGAVTLTQHK